MPDRLTNPDLVPRTRPWLVAVLTLAVFAVIERTPFMLFREVAGDWKGYPRLGAIAVLQYGPYLLAPLALAAALFGRARAFAALGLDRSVRTALAVGLAGTAVLVPGYALTATFSPAADPVYEAMRGAVLPGIAEEILFRAFLFGFLFRFARWGFLPAALVGALVFGAGHLYQGKALLDSAAVFGITAIGAFWFAWLFVEWDYNIWVPAAFHVLMNFYWTLFEVSDTALGSVWANALRVVVILLSMVITLRVARRNGGRRIQGRAWWRGGPGEPDKTGGQAALAAA